MAFVLVQHLDPTHESMLASLLQRATSIPTVTVKDGMVVQPDHLYVIPPNTRMEIERRTLSLTPRSGEKRYMPIDHFLGSLARSEKSKAIGIILSGTASDGVIGMEAIKAEGGITFAQDEKSAKYPDMPRNAVAAGCVDFVLTPKNMARELSQLGKHPYVADAGDDGAIDQAVSESSRTFPKIFSLLKKVSRVDFSFYKRATIKRRIARRMALLKMQSLDEYGAYLEETPREVEALYQDLLIKVTGFFRDPGAFTTLKNKILPLLNKNRPRDVPIRIWVPGCSTGEEAYSIAMCMVEYGRPGHAAIPCQIFATDLSEAAVERARSGIYMDSITAAVSPERLRRFFTKVPGGYQISKMVRDKCVFARQDLVKDPPFSKIDLVSCRNVLIYLEPVLHRKVFPLFHYSLNPGGYLMLGSSETVGAFSNLFGLVDRKYKIYARKQVPTPVHFDLSQPEMIVEPAGSDRRKPVGSVAQDLDVAREVDRLILSKYTPPGVVVNEDLEIIQFRGQTDRYLQPAPGKASLNLLKMVREGLLFELRDALHRAKKQAAPVRTQPIKMVQKDGTWSIRIDVVPLARTSSHERQYLVLFDEDIGAALEGRRKQGKGARRPSPAERVFDQMKQELAATKEHLQSIIEEQETTNEELKSANEEILSSNEELQSTNEELETAKEELQSTNEELTTLNEELQVRNLELTRANNDVTNLLVSANIPIVMLGSDLRIRLFTPMSEKILNLIPTDLGRPITDIKSNIDVPDLEKLIAEAIETVSTQERQVRDRQGRWYDVRIRPYKTRENKIDGAVMIFLDVDQHKRGVEELIKFRLYAEALLDEDLRIQRVNRAFHEIFRLSQRDTDGKKLLDLDGGQWNEPSLRKNLEEIVRGSDAVLRNFEMSIDLPRLSPSRRNYRISAQKVGLENVFDPRVLIIVSES